MVKWLFIFLFPHISFANSLGFANGNEFIASPVQGRVIVSCEAGTIIHHAAYTCRDVALDPVSYDFFVGPRDRRVDKVQMRAFHEDGSSEGKVSLYDGVFGRSEAAINLWISTPFQKPLLEFGRNRVSVKFLSQGAEINLNGPSQFEVFVRRGPLRVCPTAEYNSPELNDCSSQYSICQHYFQENKFCK